MPPRPTVKLQPMQPMLGAGPSGALPPAGSSTGICVLGAGTPEVAGTGRDHPLLACRGAAWQGESAAGRHPQPIQQRRAAPPEHAGSPAKAAPGARWEPGPGRAHRPPLSPRHKEGPGGAAAPGCGGAA